MLPCVCSVIDHRGRQNVVRTSVTHSAATVAHKGKTQLNIELDTQRFFAIQNNFTRCTTIFRDTKQFYSVHNNISWCKTILHGAQQYFVIQNNSTRCTTIFRDAKHFFTVHNNFSRFKTIFHGAQQAFEIQNKFSRCTTSFRDAVDTYVEQNSVSRCKIKFHDAQQKFGRLVTSTGNFISCDHTTSCSLPPCFVNTRATQFTMAASLLPTGDEKEIITYYFSRGYEYDAIVHFLAKFHDITMSIRTLKNRLRRYQLRRRTPTCGSKFGTRGNFEGAEWSWLQWR